jgi:hypothetical protein
MKIYLLLILLLLSRLSGYAQGFTMNSGGTLQKNYFAEIPYETLNGKMFVDVQINGKKHKFLFDTGAPVAVSKETAAECKLNVMVSTKFLDAFGNNDSTLVVNLNNLVLSTLVFNNIPAIEQTPEFLKCWNVDGVIGSNLFYNAIVKIDPIKQTVILTDQKEKLFLDNKNSIPLITDIGNQSDPKIKIKLKDKAFAILGFDTGESDFLRIPEDYMNQLKKVEVFEIINKGFGAKGFGEMGLEKNAEKYRLNIPFLTIANCRFNNVITETFKNTLPGIGTKLLNYGAVTLDFIHKKFYFEANKSVVDFNDKQWPIEIVVVGNKLLIGTVWGRFLDLLKPGDQITAVNGVDYTQVTLCDFIYNKPILAGKETATITVKDGSGIVKNFEIKKENLASAN